MAMPDKPKSPDINISPEAQERMELQISFDRWLKGRFKKVRQCWGEVEHSFPSELPGVDTVTFFPPPKQENPTQLIVYIRYKRDHKSAGATFKIFTDGTISGRVPTTLADRVHSNDILREVLRIAEEIDFDFWVDVDYKEGIFPPPGAWPGFGDEEEKQPVVSVQKSTLDIERLKFLRTYPGVLFGALPRSKGFNGYRVYFFPKFVILESPEIGNAAYFFDIPPIQKQRADLTESDKDLIAIGNWSRQLELSKTSLIRNGVPRFRHTGEWKIAMAREIDKRLP